MSSVTAPTTLDQMGTHRNHLVEHSRSATDQLCPAASALDVLGDTWSILLMRDLLWRGPQSAAELGRRNLGIAAHDVAVRLHRLNERGLVEVTDLEAAPPIYRVSGLGRLAEPVIEALYRFGLSTVRTQPLSPEMIVQLVTDAATDRHREVELLELTAVVGLDVSGRTLSVVLAPGILRADLSSSATDASVRCTQDVFIELLMELVSVADAVAQGEIEVVGALEPVQALFDLLRQPFSYRVDDTRS